MNDPDGHFWPDRLDGLDRLPIIEAEISFLVMRAWNYCTTRQRNKYITCFHGSLPLDLIFWSKLYLDSKCICKELSEDPKMSMNCQKWSGMTIGGLMWNSATRGKIMKKIKVIQNCPKQSQTVPICSYNTNMRKINFRESFEGPFWALEK